MRRKGLEVAVETGEEVNEVEVDPGEGAVVGRGGADPVEADLGEADLDEADLGEDPDLDTEDLEAGGNTGGDLGVEEVGGVTTRGLLGGTELRRMS